MAEGTSHAMPQGIRRLEKGRYATLDGRHEIVQDGKTWKLVEVAGDTRVGIGEFASRGLAVAKLAEDGKLPTEAPKGEQPADQPKGEDQPKAEQPAEEPKAEAKAEKPQEQPKRRPPSRKSRSKAAATV
jgi:outer membrane biosynthesis protein TonB